MLHPGAGSGQRLDGDVGLWGTDENKLAVRYAYGDGPEQVVETAAVPHETVTLRVTRDGPGPPIGSPPRGAV